MSISLQLDQVLRALADTAGVGMNATTDPAYEADKGHLYSKYVDGVNELFYEDGYGAITQITKDGQLDPGEITITLNQAYTGSGSGAGRVITADAGPVQINASSGDAVSLDGYMSLLKRTGDPTQLVSKGLLYAKDLAGAVELFYIDAAGNVTEISKAGSVYVTKIQDLAVSSAAPTDGYALTWNQGGSQWESNKPIPGGAAAGDLSGTYPKPTVAKLQGDILPTKTTDGFLKRNAGNTGWEEVVYGSTTNTVCEGDDSRLSDSREPTGSASGDLSGTYPGPTVAAIQGNPFSEVSPLDGYVPAWNAAAGKWSPQIQDGYMLQTDLLPVKTADGFLKRNSGNTGWEEVVYGSAANTVCEGDDSRLSDSREPTGSASGDLSGTYPSPTVAAIQGNPFSETAPLDGYVPAWNAAAGKWSPQIQDGYWLQGDPLPVKIASGFLKRDPANTNWEQVQYGSGPNTVCAGDDGRLSDSRTPIGGASGDLSGFYPSPTVAAIQNRAFSSNPPLDGYVAAWNAVAGKWSPQVQDGYMLQRRRVSPAVPLDGDALVWNDALDQWEPSASTDGYNGTVAVSENISLVIVNGVITNILGG